MPRKPRFNLPGFPQHVIQRGNNREPCFFAEEDYRRYLDSLAESANKYHCKIHAYVLMTNHVHLLVTPRKEFGIGQIMQALGRRYVYYVNKKYKRNGTLWEGHYKSSLVDSERYLLSCMRYIELNPVRGNRVDHPSEYKWSSYRHNAGGRYDDLIDHHSLYNEPGHNNDERKLNYRELFRDYIEDDVIHEIRDALNHELVPDCSYFKDKIELITQRQTRLGKPGRPGKNRVKGRILE